MTFLCRRGWPTHDQFIKAKNCSTLYVRSTISRTDPWLFVMASPEPITIGCLLPSMLVTLGAGRATAVILSVAGVRHRDTPLWDFAGSAIYNSISTISNKNAEPTNKLWESHIGNPSKSKSVDKISKIRLTGKIGEKNYIFDITEKWTPNRVEGFVQKENILLHGAFRIHRKGKKYLTTTFESLPKEQKPRQKNWSARRRVDPFDLSTPSVTRRHKKCYASDAKRNEHHVSV